MRAKFQGSQHRAVPPAEAEAGPSQGLGTILQGCAEQTEQASGQGLGEHCSFSSRRAAAHNAGPCGPAAGLIEAGSQGAPRLLLPPGACGSVVGKVIDEPGRDVQLGDFLQSSDASGPPQAHPAELRQGQRCF